MTRSIFISYTRADETWKNKLETHLRLLNEEASWSDDAIKTGDDWHRVIHSALVETKVAILILSEDYLKSPYVLQWELPYFRESLEKHRDSIRILPVVVGSLPTPLPPEAGFLSAIQHLPAGNTPLSSLDPRAQRAELGSLMDQIEDQLLGEQEEAGPRLSSASESIPLNIELRLEYKHRGIYDVHASVFKSPTSTASGITRFTYSANLVDECLYAEPKDIHDYQVKLTKRMRPDPDTEPAAYAQYQALAEEIEQLNYIPSLVIHLEPTSHDLHAVCWESLALCQQIEGSDYSSDIKLVRYASPGRDQWPSPLVTRRPAHLSPQLVCLDSRQTDSSRTDDYMIAGFGTPKRNPATDPLKGVVSPIVILTLDIVEELDINGSRVHSTTTRGDDVVEMVSAIARRIALTPQRPQVVILQCLPGQTGNPEIVRQLPSIAAKLITSGLSAVMTFQSPMSAGDWGQCIKIFNAELASSGNVSSAIDQVRKLFAETQDCWKPILITRLRDGDLWPIPGFLGTTSDSKWDDLCQAIEQHRCIPVIGPDISHYFMNGRSTIAAEWAEVWEYPLNANEQWDLRKVAQYVYAMKKIGMARDEFVGHVVDYARRMQNVPDDQRPSIDELTNTVWQAIQCQEPDNVYSALAALECPVYITTAYLRILSLALRTHNPTSGQSRPILDKIFSLPLAHDDIDVQQSYARQHDGYSPTHNEQYVYYMFGRIDAPNSLVLSEDDHFRFLLDFDLNWRSVPDQVRTVLARSTLLFLGFNLDSWDFRTLIQAFVEGRPGARGIKDYPHVAVQVNPRDDRVRDPRRTRDYMARYFAMVNNNPEPSLYIGTAEDFLSDLLSRLRIAPPRPISCPTPQVDIGSIGSSDES